MIHRDCRVALAAINNGSMDRSAYGHIIPEVKGLLENRVFTPVKISREQNTVAHCLATYCPLVQNRALVPVRDGLYCRLANRH